MTASRQRGFTLLELIVAIAVLAVLLVVALPSFLTSLQNNRMAANTNNMLTALQMARSEAIKRKRPVAICARDTSESTPSCGTNWSEGWIVLIDANAVGSNSASYSDFDSDVLRVWQGLNGGATISGENAPSFVCYLPNGQIDLDGSADTPEFELRIPDCRGNNARDISINRTGRAGAIRVECS